MICILEQSWFDYCNRCIRPKRSKTVWINCHNRYHILRILWTNCKIVFSRWVFHGHLSVLFVWSSRWTFVQNNVLKCHLKNKIMNYAPENFKMWSQGLTLLKFDHFTATQILREIKFWRIQSLNGPKMLFLAILKVLNFVFSKLEQLSSPKFIEN